MSPKANPKSVPPTSCSSCWHRSGVMLFIKADGVGRLQHLGRQRPHVAVQPEHRLAADGQVQVARLLGADRLEQLVDQQRSHCRVNPPAETSMEPVRLGRVPVDPGGLTLSCQPGVHRNRDVGRLELRQSSPTARPTAHYFGGRAIRSSERGTTSDATRRRAARRAAGRRPRVAPPS